MLEPGGTLLLVDCRQRWPVTQVADRHLFQFGAIGGATQEELFGGSDRVAAYLARYRTGLRRWDPPPPDGEAPEAEWGFEAALVADVDRFAGEHGYRVRRLSFEAPPDLSPLVADLYRWWYRQRSLPDDRLLVETFIPLEPWWALAAGLVPLWTTFNTEDAAAPVERHLDQRPPFAELHLTLSAHGVESVGLAPIERWHAILARATGDGRFAGVDQRLSPRFRQLRPLPPGPQRRRPAGPTARAAAASRRRGVPGAVQRPPPGPLDPLPAGPRCGRPSAAMTEPALPGRLRAPLDRHRRRPDP